MSPPVLEKLLILQDRDAKRLSLERQIEAVPGEIEAAQQKVASEKAAIDAARHEAHELESKRKLLETDIGSAGERIVKYKNQQMQVRKNDEYQALTHEITTAQAAIDALEEEELKVMYALDEAKKRFEQAAAALKNNIASHESHLQKLRERETNLQAELEAQQAEVAGARTAVAVPALRLYDRLLASGKLGLPVIVPLRELKCGGCHLKISSGIETEVRKGDELTTCDQCGRILFREA